MRIFKYILMIILSFGCQSGSENDNHWGGLFETKFLKGRHTRKQIGKPSKQTQQKELRSKL